MEKPRCRRGLNKSVSLGLLYLLICCTLSAQTLNGFVTGVYTPQDFSVGSTSIALTDKTVCQFDAAVAGRDRPSNKTQQECRTDYMSVGLHVVLEGTFTSQGSFVATRVQAIADNTLEVPGGFVQTLLGLRASQGMLIRNTLIEESPQMII